MAEINTTRMYSLDEQIRDAEQDLLDDENVLSMAEIDLEGAYKWVESRKEAVQRSKTHLKKLLNIKGEVAKLTARCECKDTFFSNGVGAIQAKAGNNYPVGKDNVDNFYHYEMH
jgi:hypothetical protein